MKKKYFGTDGIRGAINTKILMEICSLNLVWQVEHILNLKKKENKLQ